MSPELRNRAIFFKGKREDVGIFLCRHMQDAVNSISLLLKHCPSMSSRYSERSVFRRAGLGSLYLCSMFISGPVFSAETPPQVAPVAPASVETPPALSPIVATSARLGGDALRTRFVIDLTGDLKFRFFTLADPYRIIVDLPNLDFQLPEGTGRKGRGLISAYRYGLFAPGKARIVLDATGPVHIDKSFVLKAQNGQPARLVIDFVPTKRETFIVNLKQARRKAARSARATPGPKMQPKIVPRISPLSPAEKIKRGLKPVVVIDAGHGGLDPGAISIRGTKEKDVVFAFAKVLRDKLKATGRFKVEMTRDIDVFVPLQGRVQYARDHGGDLFLSIHADSVPRRSARSARGATIYTLSEKGSDREANRLAAKENRADIIAGVEFPRKRGELTDILIDLAQRETKNDSIVFANILLKKMRPHTIVRKEPHRFAAFRVLKAPDVPSVLLELGYLSNRKDEKLLKSNRWRQKVASSIVRAINQYFSQRVARIPY